MQTLCGKFICLIFTDLLPFYAILRSIPSKIGGVICMGGALVILLALPLLDRSNIRGMQFKPLMKFSFDSL